LKTAEIDRYKTRSSGLVRDSEREVKQMVEEHEAQQPYKCAICGAKFDAQQQFVEHLKQCTEKIRKQPQR
jgi:DNA-directed RNA polymerase subunit RPC12/RpoP